MTILREIGFLFQKEMTLEWRQKYALGGILLYVTSTVFVVFLSFIKVMPEVWNALFWIIALFASVNAVAKSFVQENTARQLYYYQLANPTAVILAKIAYNIFILLLINLLTYWVLGLMVGNPVATPPQYMLAIFLSSVGFSITFTFISAIAAKANNAATLMAILSFPVVLPILITLIRLSKNALQTTNTETTWNDIQTLVAIDAILLALCFVLFPYLWRE
jgi:heme exporter protein B